jgi:hypothetical protein
VLYKNFTIMSPSEVEFLIHLVGHAVAQWLRHCATNQRVVGSFADFVIGIFH